MQHSEHMALGRRKRAMVVRSSRMLALAPLALAATLSGVKGVSVAHVALASRGPPLAPHNSAWTTPRELRGDASDGAFGSFGSVGLNTRSQRQTILKVARLRGGVKRAAVKAEDSEDDMDEDDEISTGSGPLSALTGVFANMPPATRVYVLMLMLVTAVDVSVGKVIDAGATFSVDWGKTFKGLELWRPLTSLIYLGPLSMNWLTNVYFLTQHGTRLELVSGTAEQIIFLLVTGILLLMLGPLIGMSFLSTPMVAAHTYVSSRMDPLGFIQFQFLKIPLWTLPFAQMGAAVLQEEGNPMAAIPHLLGILCGHVYHFFTAVHPLMGAKRRLGAPGWMKRRLDGGDNPNFMQSPDQDEPAIPRGRKIGGGKKSTSKGNKGGLAKKGLNTKSRVKSVPEFPQAGGSCS